MGREERGLCLFPPCGWGGIVGEGGERPLNKKIPRVVGLSPTLGCQLSQGCGLSDNRVFCSWSGHLSSNDRGNKQVKFPLSLFSNSDLQKMVIQFTP